MSIKLIVSVVIVGALVAVLLLAGEYHTQPNAKLQQATEPTLPEPSPVNSKTPSHRPAEVSGATNAVEIRKVEDHTSSIADSSVDSPKWPDAVESLIFDYLSQLEGFKFTVINSVLCDTHTCEIVFSGLDPNPTIVDDYSEVTRGLYLPPINAKQGSIGTREIAAGAREFVISISNVPYEEPTAD